MNIPFFSRKKSSDKNYLGLFLKEKEGIGISITLKNGSLALEEYEKFTYSNGWENICEDVDEMLIKLEKKTNIHFKDTIFFVYSHFIDQNSKQIKKEYLSVIKTLVKSIELNALGYIEVYEAVAKFLEERDEAPLTAILAELDVDHTGIFIYKGGKVVFMRTIPKTENIVADLEMTFQELKGQIMLPSRIVLYNSNVSDDLSTKIMTHRWKEDFFIQIPRVEIVNETDILKSLVHIFEDQILGKKIQKTHEEELPEMMETPDEVESELVEAEDKEVMGFVIGKDVDEQEVGVETMPTEEPKKNLSSGIFITKIIFPFRKISTTLSSYFSKTPVLIYIIVGMVIIFISLFANEYFLHKATLKVFLPSQSLNAVLSIPATVGDNKDGLPITLSTQSASFSEKAETTGQREVGSSAKGDITLYNLEDSVKTLKKGTILQTGGISYTLDSDVDLPAATVDSASNASIPGKKSAKITASSIGPEANLEKGKRFKIADLSATIYYGINDTALTGGVKKEIRTVAKIDIDNLKAKIEKNANNSKTGSSSQATENGMKTIPQLSESTLTNLESTANAGEEADTVEVSAKVVSTYYRYHEDDLFKLISNNLAKKITSGNLLKKENVQYIFEKVDNKNGLIELKISVKAKATKETSPADIASKLILKNKKDVQTILKNDYEAEGFELSNNEPFILFGSILPIFKKNITVEISSL